MRLAVAAALGQGLVQIAIAWITAHTIDAAVFKGAALATLMPQLLTLAALFALKAGLAALADLAGFAAACRARRTLFARLVDHVVALGPVRLAGEASGEGGMTTGSALAAYTTGFYILAGAGLLLFLIAGLVNKLMHGVK